MLVLAYFALILALVVTIGIMVGVGYLVYYQFKKLRK